MDYNHSRSALPHLCGRPLSVVYCTVFPHHAVVERGLGYFAKVIVPWPTMMIATSYKAAGSEGGKGPIVSSACQSKEPLSPSKRPVPELNLVST